MQLQINEIFGPTIQGEGIWTGIPCIFMRTVGCNLRCVFAGGSFCDTPYTSHNPEPPAFSTVEEALEEVSGFFTQYPTVKHLIITGGEPMLQQQGLSEFISKFRQIHPEVLITMETNGTINNKTNIQVDLASFSPKLKTSGCFEGTDVPEKAREAHHKARKNFEAIKTLKAHIKQLKFVYSNEESGMDIDEWLKEFEESGANLDDYKILIMPEGTNENQLKESAEKAVQYCIERGYQLCDRLHIRIWGPRRGV